MAGVQVAIKGRKYKVRLISSSLTNPCTAVNNSSDDPKTKGTEYNDLIYRVCATNPPSETAPSFATFTQDELGFIGNGGQTWCLEAFTPSNGGNGVVGRGDASSDFAGIYCPPFGQSDAYRGWRPCLELIP